MPVRQRLPVSMRVLSAAVACIVLACGCDRLGIADPDLIGTVCSGPPSAAAGATVLVTTGVKNVGDDMAGVFRVGVYLSTDEAISPASDILIGSRDVPWLFPNNESVQSMPVAIPAGIPPGIYCFGIFVDDQGAQHESNEGNNILIAASTLIVEPASDANLTVTAVSAPGAAQRSQPIAVSTTVENTGASAAGPFVLSVYLSDDATLSITDRFLGSRVVPGLGPGATDTADVNFIVPSDVWPAVYYIGAIADACLSVSETDETDNAFASAATITIGTIYPPDAWEPDNSSVMAVPLVIDGPSYDRTIHDAEDTDWFKIDVSASAGIRIEVTNVVSLPNMSAELYFTDGNPDTVPFWVFPADFVLPSGGTYYLCLKAPYQTGSYTIALKSTSAVAELDVEALASATAQASAAPGGQVNCTATLAFHGNTYVPPVKTDFYLSVDSVLGGDDAYLGSITLRGASSGMVVPFSTMRTVPAGLPGGVYRMLIDADPDNDLAETNEANNTAVNSGLVYINPDVIANSVAAPPSANTGDTVMANWDISGTPAGYKAPVVYFYVSSDTVLDAADVLVTALYLVSGTGTASFRIPGGLAAGIYHVIMAVDPNRQYYETNYSNNTAASGPVAITSIPQPDLAVTAVSAAPLVVPRLGSVTLGDTVRNLSPSADAGAFKVSYQLVVDTEPAKMRRKFKAAERSLAGLAANTEDTASAAYSLPASVYPGIYYLFGIADESNTVFEENESNNALQAAGMLEVTGPETNDIYNNRAQYATTLDYRSSLPAIHNNTLHQPGDVDWAMFWGMAGETVRIETMHLTGGIDTVVELWSADNNRNPSALLVLDDNSGGEPLASAFTYTIPKTGFYLVRVYNRMPTAAGAYWLTARRQ